MNNFEQRFVQKDLVEKLSGGQHEQEVKNRAETKTYQNIEQIKLTLLDPQAISKKYDIKGRQEMKTKILERKNHLLRVGKIVNEKTGILDQKKQEIGEMDALKAKKILVLEQHLETIVTRFKKLFRIKDKSVAEMQNEIEKLGVEIGELELQSRSLRDELERLAAYQAELPDPKEMMEAYYAKMETVPLSNGEKRELLRSEVLAELSTEEYIALWRRLNPYFLSHVTRQGFRDHNAMVYHSAGLQEFHNGFACVLGDGKMLRPPIAVRNGLLARDEASVRKFIEDWVLKAKNEGEAKNRLYTQLNHSLATAPNYPDKTAVHFATQIVANDYYGGEKSNEVFFLYPSDVLASQYYYAFNGFEKNFTKPQNETKWNDVFVWPSKLDNPGIPVDAGVVFLPENTPVDPKKLSKFFFLIYTYFT